VKTFKINLFSNFNESNINLAIGNFDGVHLGHQEVIKKLVKDSIKLNRKSAILSFTPHPRQFFTKNYDDFSIIEESEKIKLFDKLNVDYYISLEFDYSLASLSAEEFVKNILFNKLNVKNITVGYDFRFGKDRKGDLELLKKLSNKYNFSVSVINQVINEKNLIVYSSSIIRNHINKGDFENVSMMLGRNWSISGKVVHGNKRAAKMNFPTANINPNNLIKPRKGVYAIKTKYLKKTYNGIANFGVRPTIDGDKLLLETHLFDFNHDIYGKDLTVEFLTFIRDEKKFDNFEKLKEQIQKDIKLTKSYHARV